MATDYLVRPGDWMMKSQAAGLTKLPTEEIVQENLRDLGQAGWELVSIAPDAHSHGLWVFRRPAAKRVTQRSFNTGTFGETQS
jgi:hypothetical protein